MRICVIVPSQGYLAQAGTRIRYNRLRDSLAALGSSLETAIIGDFRNKARLDHDVHDYFSQEGDSRCRARRCRCRAGRPGSC